MPNDTSRSETTLRDVARIIYDVMYYPGEEDGAGEVMPPFEVAEAEENGGYGLAMDAAKKLQERGHVP